MTALLQTDHIVPMPDLAGWTEEKREAEKARIRADIAGQGGRIWRERLTHNAAFDERGHRTTWVFSVDWSAAR
jgi:hypothetical protein